MCARLKLVFSMSLIKADNNTQCYFTLRTAITPSNWSKILHSLIAEHSEVSLCDKLCVELEKSIYCYKKFLEYTARLFKIYRSKVQIKNGNTSNIYASNSA